MRRPRTPRSMTSAARTWPACGLARPWSSARGRRWASEDCCGTDLGSSPSRRRRRRSPPRSSASEVPIPLELGRMRAVGVEPVTHAPLVSLGTEPGDLVVGEGAPVAPRTTLPAAAPAPLWVSVVGRLVAGGDSLTVADRRVEIERRCGAEADRPSGMVGVTAVLAGEPARLIAPCGGIRAVPAVGRSGSLGTAAAEAAALIEPSSATTADAPDGRRFIVAGLLLLASVLLAAAALAGRRFEQDPRI